MLYKNRGKRRVIVVKSPYDKKSYKFKYELNHIKMKDKTIDKEIKIKESPKVKEELALITT